MAKGNGATSLSERERIETAMQDLHTRLIDLQARERQITALEEYLRTKAQLLNRSDIKNAMMKVLPGRARRGERKEVNGEAPAPETKKKAKHWGGKGRQVNRDAPFAVAVRKWREENHATQDFLAQKLGMTGAGLTYWEQGRGLPAPNRRARVMKVLGVDESVFKL